MRGLRVPCNGRACTANDDCHMTIQWFHALTFNRACRTSGCHAGKRCTSSRPRTLARQNSAQIRRLIQGTPTGALRRCPRQSSRAFTPASATACTSSSANGGYHLCVPSCSIAVASAVTLRPLRLAATGNSQRRSGLRSPCPSTQVEQALEMEDSWCSGSQNSSFLITASSSNRPICNSHYGGHADEDGDSRRSGSRLTGCSHSGSSLAEDDQTALDFGEEETWQKMMQNLGWGKSDRSYCNSSARIDTLILHRCLLRVT